ncbi:MAG: hypothetical protein M1813_004637 [Trichoglossum hirsutum]|nr:MAG: hypothetical protein M1813_004637 [Trichoglossum hirsutum]
MAMLCKTFATVMTDDPKKIPLTGIWGRIELPTLELTGNPGGQVDTIIAVNTKGDDVEEVWTRPGTAPKTKTRSSRSTSSENEKKSLSKRQPNNCYNPDQLQQWFGDVNCRSISSLFERSWKAVLSHPLPELTSASTEAPRRLRRCIITAIQLSSDYIASALPGLPQSEQLRHPKVESGAVRVASVNFVRQNYVCLVSEVDHSKVIRR